MRKKQETMVDVFRYKDLLFDEITQDWGRDQALVCYGHAKYHRLVNQPDIRAEYIGRHPETCGVIGCREQAEFDLRFDGDALKWERIPESEYKKLIEPELEPEDEPELDL